MQLKQQTSGHNNIPFLGVIYSNYLRRLIPLTNQKTRITSSNCMSSKFNIFTVVVPSELQWKSTIPGDGKQADRSYSTEV